MKVPTVEVRWVPERSQTLVQVIFKLTDDETYWQCGTGSTLIEALENLVRNLRNRAEREDEHRMRRVLEVI